MTLKLIVALIQLASTIMSWLERARIKAEGKAEAYAEQKAKNDALQAHYDDIEAGPRDLDASLGRLKERTTKK